MLEFLLALKDEKQDVLKRILRDYQDELGLGFRALHEVNEYEYHDQQLPDSEYDKRRFFDSDLLPGFVKLTEAVFSNLILPFAVKERLSRGKKSNGLDTYHRVQETRRGAYRYLAGEYSNTIRNAIAHGTVTYRADGVVFVDRTRRIELGYSEMVWRFDRMTDICNGLALGLARFYFEHQVWLEQMGIPVPPSFLVQELRLHADAPGWSVATCLESLLAGGQRQLNVFVQNNLLDRRKVEYHAFRTAVLAESMAPGYPRYFLRLDSRPSWRQVVGFAGFDGAVLRRIRRAENGEVTPKDYAQALERPGVFFVPALKLPRFVLRLSSLIMALKIVAQVTWWRHIDQDPKAGSDVRKAELHRNGAYCVVTASVVLASEHNGEEVVRSRCRALVRKAVKVARRRTKRLALGRYLPVGFARVSAYRRDFRVRHLGVSGLIPELIATIEFKRLARVRTIDIIGGTPDIIQGCRVVWNRNPSRTVDE